MCKIANQLKLAWYATAKPLKADDPDLPLKLEEDHETPAYKRTLEIYKMHRDTCPMCKAELAQAAPLVIVRPRPNIQPEPKPFERVNPWP